eukprot:scaffold1900_cov389-Prasinococcus_capsulatus_cf.AAC.14
MAQGPLTGNAWNDPETNHGTGSIDAFIAKGSIGVFAQRAHQNKGYCSQVGKDTHAHHHSAQMLRRATYAGGDPSQADSQAYVEQNVSHKQPPGRQRRAVHR